MKPGDRVRHTVDEPLVGTVIDTEDGKLLVECPRCGGSLRRDCALCEGVRTVTFETATRHLSAPMIAVAWDGYVPPLAERKSVLAVLSVVDALAGLA